MIEIMLILFILVLNIISVFVVQYKVNFDVNYQLKKSITMSFVLILSSICVAFLAFQLNYKSYFHNNGEIFKNSTIAKIEITETQKRLRIFPDEQTDLRSPNFLKLPDVQAIMINDNLTYKIKFIDPFSKTKEDNVIGGTVLTAFVDKKSSGKIFGTEFYVNVYMTYNNKTNNYDKYLAQVLQHETKLLVCNLDKVPENSTKIIAKGSCNLVK